MPKVAEIVLSEAFKIGFESANDCTKTAILYLVEQMLIKIAQNGAPKKAFDRITERLKQL